MDYFRIEGPVKLSGEVAVSGAKNAALPLIAMTLLAKNPVRISNLPEVVDIHTLLGLLDRLGATFEREGAGEYPEFGIAPPPNSPRPKIFELEQLLLKSECVQFLRNPLYCLFQLL